MQYLPTVNLWDPATARALATGQLRLQRGQWVQCGPGHRSRFFKTSATGVVWAAHWPRHVEQFNSWVEAERGRARRASA